MPSAGGKRATARALQSSNGRSSCSTTFSIRCDPLIPVDARYETCLALRREEPERFAFEQSRVHRFSREEGGLMVRIYWSSACPGCPMRKQCTTSNYRRIRRWQHEHILEAMQRRLDRRPDAMLLRARSSTCSAR